MIRKVVSIPIQWNANKTPQKLDHSYPITTLCISTQKYTNVSISRLYIICFWNVLVIHVCSFFHVKTCAKSGHSNLYLSRTTQPLRKDVYLYHVWWYCVTETNGILLKIVFLPYWLMYEKYTTYITTYLWNAQHLDTQTASVA